MTSQEFITKWVPKVERPMDIKSPGYLFWCLSYDESQPYIKELCDDFLSLEENNKTGMSFKRAMNIVGKC